VVRLRLLYPPWGVPEPLLLEVILPLHPEAEKNQREEKIQPEKNKKRERKKNKKRRVLRSTISLIVVIC